MLACITSISFASCLVNSIIVGSEFGVGAGLEVGTGGVLTILTFDSLRS